MKRLVLLGLVVASLSACETIEGFGQDVSTAGNAISHTANDVRY